MCFLKGEKFLSSFIESAGTVKYSFPKRKVYVFKLLFPCHGPHALGFSYCSFCFVFFSISLQLMRLYYQNKRRMETVEDNLSLTYVFKKILITNQCFLAQVLHIEDNQFFISIESFSSPSFLPATSSSLKQSKLITKPVIC